MGKDNKKKDYFTDADFKIKLKETLHEKYVGVTFLIILSSMNISIMSLVKLIKLQELLREVLNT